MFFIISLFFVFGAVLEYVIVRLYSEKIKRRSASDRDMVDIEMMSQKRQVSSKSLISEDSWQIPLARFKGLDGIE